MTGIKGIDLPVVRFLLGGVCHQFADHSLHYGGEPLPLCSRCMGTYLAIALAFVVLRLIGRRRSARLPTWSTAWVVAVLVGMWALDGVNSLAHFVNGSPWLYMPSNTLRLITGAGCGLAMGVMLYPAWHYVLWHDIDPRPVLEHPAQWLPLLAAGGALVGGLLLWPGAPYPLWGGAIILASFGVLAGVNGMLVALLWRREGTVRSSREVALYLGLGLGAATVEMGLMRLLQWAVLG